MKGNPISAILPTTRNQAKAFINGLMVTSTWVIGKATREMAKASSRSQTERGASAPGKTVENTERASLPKPTAWSQKMSGMKANALTDRGSYRAETKPK